jgi:16S rRNA (uracil1498-N3)-methyltransferase
MFFMAGFRAYHENLSAAKPGDILALSPEESRHLCGALRAKADDRVGVFDLASNVFAARILKVSPKCAHVELLAKSVVPTPKPKITIAQCLPKGGTFDAIISQSVQLGVSGIYPIVSERTIVRLDAKDAAKKHVKWTAQVVEAVKQSANMSGLRLAPVAFFKDFLKSLPANSLKIVASLERDKTKPLLSILETANEPFDELCILIGPEGDLSESEYSAAYDAGLIPADLGCNVMKSDIAAAFCASVASAFFASKP